MISVLIPLKIRFDRQYFHGNICQNIKLTIDSLLSKKNIGEIIIICQSDEKIIIKGKKLKIIMVDNQESFNRSWLLNIGINYSKYDIIMPFDIDNFCFDEFDEFYLNHKHLLVDNFICFPLILHPCYHESQFKMKSKLVKSICQLDLMKKYKANSFRLDAKFFENEILLFLKDKKNIVKTIDHSCFLCQKKKIIDIGGYNEKFSTFGYQDLDLSLRLRQNGVKVFETNHYIIHRPHVHKSVLIKDNKYVDFIKALYMLMKSFFKREIIANNCKFGNMESINNKINDEKVIDLEKKMIQSQLDYIHDAYGFYYNYILSDCDCGICQDMIDVYLKKICGYPEGINSPQFQDLLLSGFPSDEKHSFLEKIPSIYEEDDNDYEDGELCSKKMHNIFFPAKLAQKVCNHFLK